MDEEGAQAQLTASQRHLKPCKGDFIQDRVRHEKGEEVVAALYEHRLLLASSPNLQELQYGGEDGTGGNVGLSPSKEEEAGPRVERLGQAQQQVA